LGSLSVGPFENALNTKIPSTDMGMADSGVNGWGLFLKNYLAKF
jgi:hypothetical protein